MYDPPHQASGQTSLHCISCSRHHVNVLPVVKASYSCGVIVTTSSHFTVMPVSNGLPGRSGGHAFITAIKNAQLVMQELHLECLFLAHWDLHTCSQLSKLATFCQKVFTLDLSRIVSCGDLISPSPPVAGLLVRCWEARRFCNCPRRAKSLFLVRPEKSLCLCNRPLAAHHLYCLTEALPPPPSPPLLFALPFVCATGVQTASSACSSHTLGLQ